MRVGCLLVLPVLALVAVCVRIKHAHDEESDVVHELESDDATMRATPSSDYLFSEHVPVLPAGGGSAKDQGAYTTEPVAFMRPCVHASMRLGVVLAALVFCCRARRGPAAAPVVAKAATHAIGGG